jgi:hypothetical protein
MLRFVNDLAPTEALQKTSPDGGAPASTIPRSLSTPDRGAQVHAHRSGEAVVPNARARAGSYNASGWVKNEPQLGANDQTSGMDRGKDDAPTEVLHFCREN